MENQSENPFDCCPPFEPEAWDCKIFEWDKKPFVKSKVRTFFFMPMNFGQVMRKVDKKMKAANANIADWLCLSDHTSKWNMDLYLASDREVPGIENTTLSGKFYCKVYEGNFNKTGEWCKDYEMDAKSKGYLIKKWYMWYTTCPKCAKKFGKNYVVVVGQVE